MKRVLFILLLSVMVAVPALAEDIMDKSAITPVATDQVYLVDDPGGTPADGRASIQDVVDEALKAPGPIGGTTPAAGAFSSVTIDGTALNSAANLETIIGGGEYMNTLLDFASAGALVDAVETENWTFSGTNNFGLTLSDLPTSGGAWSAGSINPTFGSVTGTSFTTTKSSGVAGLSYVYEANFTDTDYIGWMGPESISGSFSFQFPDAQPDGTVYAWGAPAGDGDPNGNPVSAATAYTIATTVGDPGSDTVFVSEQGIREALDLYVLKVLDSTPDTNDTWDGRTMVVTAGEAILQWDIVYLKYDTNGPRAFKYNADSTDGDNDNYAPVGIATEAQGSAGSTFSIGIGLGIARNDEWTFTDAQDEGKRVYCSDTVDGGITLTAPSASGDHVIRIGTLIEEDEILFNFGFADAVIE